MAKKKPISIKKTSTGNRTTKKKNPRKPKVGDTVYKKYDSDSRKWLYQSNVSIKGKNLAYITSSILEVVNGESIETIGLIDFVSKDSITIIMPLGPPSKIGYF